VPQDCVLFNDTLLYNIAYGGIWSEEVREMMENQEKESDKLIEAIVASSKRAQIHPFIMDRNKGYHEQVGERGLKLSGGEKQRVAIARALMKRAKILCFDEATSALDTQTEHEVQQAINDVSKGATTLIIAHRLSTVQKCDKIIVIKHGVIVEEGTHAELIEREEGYYQRLWNRQSE